MGTTEEVFRTEIKNTTYATTKYTATYAHDLAPVVAAVLGTKLMTLIMVPVSKGLESMRAPSDEGDGDIETALAVAVAEVLVSLEEPEVMATLAVELAERARLHSGGLSRWLKMILVNTTADPIRILGDGAQATRGNPQSVVTHYDTHFGAGFRGLYEALSVALWVLRINLGEA